MHLRRFRIRKGTVALSSRGGEELCSLPVLSVLCPAQRWRPWACSCWTARSPRELGVGGAEGVRSPRVIAKKGLGEELVAKAGGGDDSPGVSGYQNVV